MQNELDDWVLYELGWLRIEPPQILDTGNRLQILPQSMDSLLVNDSRRTSALHFLSYSITTTKSQTHDNHATYWNSSEIISRRWMLVR